MRDDSDDDEEDDRPRSRRRDRDEEDDDDDDRPRRRGRFGRDDDDEDDDRPRRRAAPAQGGTDTCGILSVVLGAVALVLIPVGCCCAPTIYVAVPVAVVGGALGMWGQGALRVIGLVLNILAVLPAALLTVLLIVGVTLPRPMGAGNGVNNPPQAFPWNPPPAR
jgi:hypothetical protein